MNHNKYKKVSSLSEIKDIESKKLIEKLMKKVPSWYDFDIDLPTSVSIEQSSSDITANIKTEIIQYETAIDLTGGFGVDSYFFAKKANSLIYIERNAELLEIVKKNFEILGISNVEFKNQSAEVFLNSFKEKVDLIYCDPSRRNESKKVFKLEDSEPNIIELYDRIKSKCRYLLLKTSPFLDINYVISCFERISRIILISIENELKEVLYLFDFEKIEKIDYQVYLINKNIVKKYAYKLEKFEISYNFDDKYIYEPDNAIMKLGNFSEIAQLYKLSKLEINTHLYSSNEIIDDFPGKIYKIIGVEKVNDKVLRKYSNTNKFNLKIRNFPDTVENLKKKLKIIDGGNIFIFATKLFNKKYVLIICEKLII